MSLEEVCVVEGLVEENLQGKANKKTLGNNLVRKPLAEPETRGYLTEGPLWSRGIVLHSEQILTDG